MRVRTEARREALLEKAAQVFMEKGYERTSMLEIAKRSGCSKPTLYGYFPSKAELFLAVVLKCIGQQVVPAFADLQSRVQDDPGLVLTQLGEYYIASIALPETFALKRLVAATMTKKNDAERFWELGNKQAVCIIERYLQAASEAGRLVITNARIAAQQLLSLYGAEINWHGPLAPDFSAAQIHEASTMAVRVFLAAYGCA